MRVCDIFQVVHGKVRSWEMLSLVVIMLMTPGNPRKTGCINLHDQDVTCFNICLLTVPCRRDGLCQMPGTGRQKIFSCRMFPEAGGEQFVLCASGFPHAELSETSDFPADTGN